MRNTENSTNEFSEYDWNKGLAIALDIHKCGESRGREGDDEWKKALGPNGYEECHATGLYATGFLFENILNWCYANCEDQEINADMFEDIDDPTAKKTNDEDQVVEESVVALPYKLINKLNKLLLSVSFQIFIIILLVMAIFVQDNVFIMSNPKSKLISDLVVVIVSATCGGIAFACAGQPAITGYLLAGSVIGPGGLSFVSELVRLRIVRAVAIMGGLLQIFLFMCLSGVIAVKLIFAVEKVLAFEYNFSASTMVGGCKLTVVKKTFDGEDIKGERVFLGSLKFVLEKKVLALSTGQVNVGTYFAGFCGGFIICAASDPRWLVTFITFLAVLSLFSRTCIPWFINLMISLSSQTNELYQLASVAFCLIVASSPAGVMISTTDHAQHTLEQVGMSLAQIREFAFVLLNRASNLHLIEVRVRQAVSSASWHDNSLVRNFSSFSPKRTKMKQSNAVNFCIRN
ncbi:hypothetical protein Tco_0012442 [Tanacetum coccineum]